MLPDYSSCSLFNTKHIEHYFFYKKSHNQNFDFRAPLEDNLAQTILNEFQLNRLLVPQQNHTANIAIFPSSEGFSYVDGIITGQKKVGLLVRHADCQAAFFYDEKKQVVAAVHAGFRGQIQKIYSETLKKMKQDFGCAMQDIKVAISPSLGFDHAEFINYKTEFPQSLHTYQKDGYMDLKKMAFDELVLMGIHPSSIDIDERCTFCDDALFYSYRKNKTQSRLASLIFLK